MARKFMITGQDVYCMGCAFDLLPRGKVAHHNLAEAALPLDLGFVTFGQNGSWPLGKRCIATGQRDASLLHRMTVWHFAVAESCCRCTNGCHHAI